jgi:hypothetical protein
MRLHWAVYFWLLGLALICLIALILPVPPASANYLNVCFGIVFVLAWMAVGYWAIFQLHLSPRLLRHCRARHAVYLLAGYFLILNAYFVWPHAFVRILEGRIASRFSEGDLRNDIKQLAILRALVLFESSATKGGARPEMSPVAIRALEKIALKYQKYGLSSDRYRWESRTSELEESIDVVLLLKGIGSEEIHDPRIYRLWLAVPQVALMLVLLMRTLQGMGSEFEMVVVIVAGFPFVGAAPIMYSGVSDFFWSHDLFSWTLLVLFLAGGYASLMATQIKTKNSFLVAGVTTFTLLLAWIPCILLSLTTEDAPSTELVMCLFSLGVALLFVVTPWLQHRHLALGALPS